MMLFITILFIIARTEPVQKTEGKVLLHQMPCLSPNKGSRRVNVRHVCITWLVSAIGTKRGTKRTEEFQEGWGFLKKKNTCMGKRDINDWCDRNCVFQRLVNYNF